MIKHIAYGTGYVYGFIQSVVDGVKFGIIVNKQRKYFVEPEERVIFNIDVGIGDNVAITDEEAAAQLLDYASKNPVLRKYIVLKD